MPNDHTPPKKSATETLAALVAQRKGAAGGGAFGLATALRTVGAAASSASKNKPALRK
jgi:hypothetical protein